MELKPMPGAQAAQPAVRGMVTSATPPGHYVNYCQCGDCAQIIAVDVFAGAEAYTDILPGLTVVKIESMRKTEAKDDGRFMAIYFLRLAY